MIKADILIHNGMILTMDENYTVIPDGLLCITGDKISYIGEKDKEAVQAGKKIDAQRGLILPGLINSHTHAAMTLFRGLADDLPLMEWLNGYIFPVEKSMDEDFVRTGTMLACAEMIMTGTTTFCDMYLFEEEVVKAAKEAGIRCIAGEVLYDFPSPNYGDLVNGFRYTENLINKWKYDPTIKIAVEPHSIFTCSGDLLSRANELALERGVPLILHLAETTHEVKEVEAKFGKRPVQYLKDLGLLGPHLILDHCVHINESEIELLSENNVNVVHNPESNMKLASGIAPVPEMIARGINVGLGTDGCASNNNLDMFGEMDMAAKLHKVNKLDPTVMNAKTIITMATIHGAKVLGLGKKIGSLIVGKKADIIVIDLNKPHLTPLYNPYSHIVYAANGHDVKDSVIHGRIVMENRRLLTIDIEDVMEKARQKSEMVKKWVKNG
jgi:5-methylthioadenosine/S-adenosylhomocysteine deaminase